MGFLAEDLIESVKDRSFAPISQTTFQDPDILRILNEELSLKMVAAIQKQREDFFVTRSSTALVANKDHYLLPKNTVGNSLKALFLVDSSGTKALLQRRDIDRIHEYSNQPGQAGEFYFEGDQIALMRAPSASTDSLLFIYSRRPNQIIATSSCAKITSSSSLAGTTTFNVDTDLTSSLAVGQKVDFLRNESPFALWAEDVLITAITSTTIAVATTDVSDVDGSLEPGTNDYICPAGFSCIPMLPIEFHPVLAEMAVCRMLRSMGDVQKWQVSKAELKESLEDAISLIKNRSESTPERPSRKNGLIRNFRAA